MKRPHDDRRQRGHRLHHRPDQPGEPSGHLVEEDRADQADGDGEGERQRDLLQRPDDRVQDAPGGQGVERARRAHVLGVEVQVRQRLPALEEGVDDHEHQRHEHEQREALDHHPGHLVADGGSRLVERHEERVHAEEQEVRDHDEAHEAVEGQQPGEEQAGERERRGGGPHQRVHITAARQ